MNEQIAEALELTNNSPKKYGMVILLELNHDTDPKTFTVIGYSGPYHYFEALDAYSEIPNPASQLITFNTPEEYVTKIGELIVNINNPEWCKKLLECI